MLSAGGQWTVLGSEKRRKQQDRDALSREEGILECCGIEYNWGPHGQGDRNVPAHGHILWVGGNPVEIAWGRREQGKLGPRPFSEHQEGVHVFGRSGPRGDSASCHCSGLGLL